MEEDALLRLSFTVAMVGLISLFLVMKATPYQEYSPGLVRNDSWQEKDVRYSGRISGIAETKESIILEVSTKAHASVIIPKDKQGPLRTGQDIVVHGTVEEFNDKEYLQPSLVEIYP